MVEKLVLQYQESTRRRELAFDKILCDGGCGRTIPLAALRHSHGLPEWCGAARGLDGKVYCPPLLSQANGRPPAPRVTGPSRMYKGTPDRRLLFNHSYAS